MTGVTRRAAVAGLATALLPGVARAGAADPVDLGARLDRAATLAPDRALASLADIDAGTLTAGARLDLVTARAGLAVDAALARVARPGRAPYRLTPRGGAWIGATDPARIDAERDAVLADAADGIVPPRPILERTIVAVRARRAAAAPAVAPALDRLADTLATLVDRAPPPGMRHLPNGAAWYALLLRRHGSDLSPTDADAMLAREEARLARRAAAAFAAIGDREGSVGTRFGRLWRDPRFLYPDDAAGRSRAVADMNAVLAAIRMRMPTVLPGLPAWQGAVAARAMTAAEDAGGVQGFRTLPTPTSPGAYVVDLRRIRDRPRWTLPGVVAHELLPGHMAQLPIEAATPPHRLRIDYAAGFPEGWAIFAEVLAHGRGWLGDDPRVLLGHLHWLLFRIARARADLALHHRGEPIAAIRARMAALLGRPAYFIDFDTDLERTATEPGVRVAEATSWLALARAAATARDLVPLIRDGRRRDADIAAA